MNFFYEDFLLISSVLSHLEIWFHGTGFVRIRASCGGHDEANPWHFVR